MTLSGSCFIVAARVRLAGAKVIRMFKPADGRAIFSKIQEQIGASGSAVFRGEEMMQGAERVILEQEVWHKQRDNVFEAKLNGGDALFIPRGWWHSVKSVGTGINGSVSGIAALL